MRLLPILASLSILATFVATDASASASMCSSLFESRPNSEMEAIERVESDSLAVLTRVSLTPKEAETDVRNWIRDMSDRFDAGRTPSVMDHSAMIHIARSGFLDQFEDAPDLSKSLNESIVKSWKALTGQDLALEAILAKPLPNSVLRSGTDRELKYHRAVFESPTQVVSDPKSTAFSPKNIKKYLAATLLLSIGFAEHANVPGAKVLAGAITGYSVSALTEYLIHRFRLHSTKATSDFLKRTLGEKFLFAYRYHTGHHHRMFTAKKYSVENNADWQGARVHETNPRLRVIDKNDELALKQGDEPEALHENQYGMSMNKREITEASIGTISIAAVASYFLGFGHEGITAAIFTAPATAFATAYLHPYLHTPSETLKRHANPFIKFLTGTRYWKLVSRLHYVHHVAPTAANFSLFLPGPDWMFNTIENPDVDALVRMDQLGIIF